MFRGVTEREVGGDLEAAFAFLLGVCRESESAEVSRFVADAEDSAIEVMVFSMVRAVIDTSGDKQMLDVAMVEEVAAVMARFRVFRTRRRVRK